MTTASSAPSMRPAAKVSRRNMKRREAIDNRVAKNKLQKQLNNKNFSQVVNISRSERTTEGDRADVTPEMVDNFRSRQTIDRINALLPSAKKLRNAIYANSALVSSGKGNSVMKYNANQAFPRHLKLEDVAPWLLTAAGPTSLDEELNCFCDYVQV